MQLIRISKFGERNKMELFEQFSREAIESLEGKKLPVTVEINGTKQVIGEATFSIEEDDAHFKLRIKKEFSGLVTDDLRHFALVDTDWREIGS
jgi:hypothetical protein